MNTPVDIQWRKSSYSMHNGECVEVAPNVLRGVGMRDSKNPGTGHIAVSRAAFTALLRTVR